MSQWYKLSAQMGHQGAGRSLDVNIFVWAEDPLEVWNRYKYMGGLRKKKTPDIAPLSPEEASELERKILEKGLILKKIKRSWYFPDKLSLSL